MYKINYIESFNPAYLYITFAYVIVNILVVHLFRLGEIFRVIDHSLLYKNVKNIKIGFE